MFKYKEKEIDFVSTLIIVLMVFSPYTELRLAGLFGIPELCLILLIVYIGSKNFTRRYPLFQKNDFSFSRFWAIFLILSILGMSINYIVMFHFSGTINSLIFNLATYLFLFIGLASLEIFRYSCRLNFHTILFRIFLFSTLTMGILFLISQFRTSLFGYQIKHYRFFRPLANNIHQVSMVILPLPFIGLLFIKWKIKAIIWNIVIISMIFLNIIMALETGSFKAIVGLVFGGIYLLYNLIINSIKGKYTKILFILLFTIILIFLIATNISDLIRYFLIIFQENDIGGGRERLYSTGFQKGLDSFLFGYGPGSHVLSRYGTHYQDAHQTLLAIFLQAGVFGVYIYLSLWARVFIRLSSYSILSSALIPIFVYAMGGDILRRLPMWIYLFLLYYYGREKEKNEKNHICRDSFLS